MIAKVNGMQGSECQIHFELKAKSDGNPINLTGARVKSCFKYDKNDSDDDSIVIKTTDPDGDIVITDAVNGKGTVYLRGEDTEVISITTFRNIYTQVCATLKSGQITKSPNVMLILEAGTVKTPLVVEEEE